MSRGAFTRCWSHAMLEQQRRGRTSRHRVASLRARIGAGATVSDPEDLTPTLGPRCETRTSDTLPAHRSVEIDRAGSHRGWSHGVRPGGSDTLSERDLVAALEGQGLARLVR